MSFSAFEGDKPRVIGRFEITPADQLIEVLYTAAPWARTAIVTFEGNAGKVLHTGTDGAAIGAAFYESVAADTPKRVELTAGRETTPRARLLVTSATNNTFVSVALFERARGA